jgi:hypothetical protein
MAKEIKEKLEDGERIIRKNEDIDNRKKKELEINEKKRTEERRERNK